MLLEAEQAVESSAAAFEAIDVLLRPFFDGTLSCYDDLATLLREVVDALPSTSAIQDDKPRTSDGLESVLIDLFWSLDQTHEQREAQLPPASACQ